MAAAAAGKTESVSLSLLLEVNSLKVERNFPLWPRLLGHKELGWKNDPESRKGSRSGSDVDASERTCRSCNVRGRTTCWTKWAAEHELKELKEGVWFDPINAMVRRKTNEEWTDKHRDVLRKVVVEGGWVQQRLCESGWSDENKLSRM